MRLSHKMHKANACWCGPNRKATRLSENSKVDLDKHLVLVFHSSCHWKFWQSWQQYDAVVIYDDVASRGSKPNGSFSDAVSVVSKGRRLSTYQLERMSSKRPQPNLR
jgi:hypothetical protein